jgi:hypothetical protein
MMKRTDLVALAYRAIYESDARTMQAFLAFAAPIVAGDDLAIEQLGELSDLFEISMSYERSRAFGGQEQVHVRMVNTLHALRERLPETV